MTVLQPFLRSTSTVDWQQPDIVAQARELARTAVNPVDVARTCFEWVRDEVPHTVDCHLDQITCSASEVFRERTGFCYAKSHLLAALLRANGIPTGFVYQRLTLDEHGAAFCLHGLNAVWLPDMGWYRMDARGNRGALRADFDPPREVLPFACVLPGEQFFQGIWAEPLQCVVDALRKYRTRAELEANLPDAIDLDSTREQAEWHLVQSASSTTRAPNRIDSHLK